MKDTVKKWLVPRKDDPINSFLCTLAPALGAVQWVLILLLVIIASGLSDAGLPLAEFGIVIPPATIFLSVGIRAFWSGVAHQLGALGLVLANASILQLINSSLNRFMFYPQEGTVKVIDSLVGYLALSACCGMGCIFASMLFMIACDSVVKLIKLAGLNTQPFAPTLSRFSIRFAWTGIVLFLCGFMSSLIISVSRLYFDGN